MKLKDAGAKNYQTFFYTEAIHALEETMPESSVDGFIEEQVARGLAFKAEDNRPNTLTRIKAEKGEARSEELYSTLKIASCSLLMP